MTNKARLIVDYENCFPVRARCSLCGDELAQSEPPIILIGETILSFALQFIDHMEKKHLSNDVNGL